MKLSCEIVQDLLPLYCDGVCSEESRQAVEAHLEGCDACRADVDLLEQDMSAGPAQPREETAVRAAAAAWKRGKSRALLKGCLLALLSVALLAAGYCACHWFSTAGEQDPDALARQAADYLGCGALRIEETEQRGDYLAALCTGTDGSRYLCVFERDRLFQSRWRANGGKLGLKDGAISSWNYGSPKKEAVLIFCGSGLPEEASWYSFQNSGVTYLCPIEGGQTLDIFIIPDQSDINGVPVLLDRNQQEME